ncbi:MAG: FAD-binding protein, partial [bacterium]
QSWYGFVSNCVAAGLYGVENLSGIPGTVGAAPVQNIGAYGDEVKNSIQSVRAFDTQTNAFTEFTAQECQFEYRDSIFKKQAGRHIVTSVVFALKKEGSVNTEYKDLKDFFLESPLSDASPTAALSAVRKAVLIIRARKLPDVLVPGTVGTAGSFFKNPIIPTEQYIELKKKYPELPSYPAASPAGVDADVGAGGARLFVKIPLGWVLEHVCAYKGVAKGNVGTYKNQALVLINNGNATAQEVKAFAEEIAATVKEKTGIVIEPEVQYI